MTTIQELPEDVLVMHLFPFDITRWLNLSKDFERITEPYLLEILGVSPHDKLTHLTWSKRSRADYWRPKPTSGQWMIRQAGAAGYTKLVRMLLAMEDVDPASARHEALRMACRYGHIETVRMFLDDKRVSPAKCPECIVGAAANGHSAIVRMLLDDGRVDIGYQKGWASKSAIIAGHEDIALMLANHKPTTHFGFVEACIHNMVKLVEELLNRPNCPVDADDNAAITLSSINGHAKVVELLLRHPKCDAFAAVSHEALKHESVVKLLIADERIESRLRGLRQK